MSFSQKITKNESLIVLLKIVVIVSLVEFIYMDLSGRLETLFRFSSGIVALINVIVLNVVTAPLMYFLVIKPFINDRDKAYEYITELSLLDPLTQLLNRRGLDRALASDKNDALNQYSALMLLDLDGFKDVNDTHGHECGDKVLIEVSQRLQSIIRDRDIACRLGGDEFVLVFKNMSPSEDLIIEKVDNICQKILAIVPEPIRMEGVEVAVGVSMGVSVFTPQNQLDDVLSQADIAMYSVKKSGKNNYKMYSS